MATNPVHVEVSEASLKTLTTTFKSAYKQIVSEIDGATNFGVNNRKQILNQVGVILTDLGVNVHDFVKVEIPQYYKTGANDAVSQLKNIGAKVPVSTGFNRVHKEAIANLVSDTSKSFADSIQGVSRSANLLLNKMMKAEIRQRIATGQIQGVAVKDAANSIKQYLKEQGLSALKDKAGRTWQLDTYAEMLYRTKSVEARNMGLADRMLENDYDLVQVSEHGTLEPMCMPWEGQILSLTGSTPGYPTLDDAEATGLFHPNCEHAINAISDLAAYTKAYNPDTGEYEMGGGLDSSAPQYAIST